MDWKYIVIGVSLLIALLWRGPGRRRRAQCDPLFKRTGPHWRRNYSRRSFLRLGGTLTAAGILAYSGLDEAAEGWYAGTVRSQGSDTLARVVKPLGERFWFWSWLTDQCGFSNVEWLFLACCKHKQNENKSNNKMFHTVYSITLIFPCVFGRGSDHQIYSPGSSKVYSK